MMTMTIMMMIMISCGPLQIIKGKVAADVGVVFVCVEVGHFGRCRCLDVCVWMRVYNGEITCHGLQ